MLIPSRYSLSKPNVGMARVQMKLCRTACIFAPAKVKSFCPPCFVEILFRTEGFVDEDEICFGTVDFKFTSNN